MAIHLLTTCLLNAIMLSIKPPYLKRLFTRSLWNKNITCHYSPLLSRNNYRRTSFFGRHKSLIFGFGGLSVFAPVAYLIVNDPELLKDAFRSLLSYISDIGDRIIEKIEEERSRPPIWTPPPRKSAAEFREDWEAARAAERLRYVDSIMFLGHEKGKREPNISAKVLTPEIQEKVWEIHWDEFTPEAEGEYNEEEEDQEESDHPIF